jgi:hypothetical protein
MQTPSKAQPTGADDLSGDIRLAASCSASRELSAMIVSAGLALPCVGVRCPSVTNRFGTSQQRWGRPPKPASWTATIAPGLYAEEYDARQRQLRGNLPQAFVHSLAVECGLMISPERAP